MLVVGGTEKKLSVFFFQIKEGCRPQKTLVHVCAKKTSRRHFEVCTLLKNKHSARVYVCASSARRRQKLSRRSAEKKQTTPQNCKVPFQQFSSVVVGMVSFTAHRGIALRKEIFFQPSSTSIFCVFSVLEMTKLSTKCVSTSKLEDNIITLVFSWVNIGGNTRTVTGLFGMIILQYFVIVFVLFFLLPISPFSGGF